MCGLVPGQTAPRLKLFVTRGTNEFWWFLAHGQLMAHKFILIVEFAGTAFAFEHIGVLLPLFFDDTCIGWMVFFRLLLFIVRNNNSSSNSGIFHALMIEKILFDNVNLFTCETWKQFFHIDFFVFHFEMVVQW
jgi:hypothetical protein